MRPDAEGSLKLHRVEENLGALELTPADLREINASLSKIDVHGERRQKRL